MHIYVIWKEKLLQYRKLNKQKISFLTITLIFSIIIGITFFHTSIGIPNKIRLKVLFISFLPSIIISLFIILKKNYQ